MIRQVVLLVLLGVFCLVGAPDKASAECNYARLAVCSEEKASCYARVNTVSGIVGTTGAIHCSVISFVPGVGAVGGIVCAISHITAAQLWSQSSPPVNPVSSTGV